MIPFASNGKGKILLATVKGDVHDIGKNLVEIILSNNGFKIVNLGIKVTSNELIEAIRRENPTAIGLSGLLVKSAQQMVLTAQDLKAQNISIPILVGGAALTRKFTDTKISAEYDGLVLYAKDAMNGLELANKIIKTEEQIRLLEEKRKQLEMSVDDNQAKIANEVKLVEKRSNISTNVPVFTPSDLKPHILREYKLSHLEPYINMQMLLGKHLGLQGKISRLLEEKNEKAMALKDNVDSLLADAKENGIITANGIYQFFPAQSSGNDVIIYDPENKKNEIERFTFPRQKQEPYLCLADYLRPVSSGEMDYVGFLAVTAGEGVREKALAAKEAGDYLYSHMIQAVALELAEGFAERVHQMMRDQWGFPDPPEFTMQERFSAKYQGVRVSFGYPACPNLEDQAKLFQLINPEKIGVRLSEEYMMDPEASVTAMVFAHPEGRYFNVL